jgi:hypothetical protein
MDMSAAALPPCQPAISEADRSHPLFPAYMQHRNSCIRLMVTANTFEGFKFQARHEAKCDVAEEHPRFKEFQSWMRETKAGGRKCPAGSFPENFYFWVEGGRW